jgi:Tripartite tricarboxylate transporter family receptor
METRRLARVREFEPPHGGIKNSSIEVIRKLHKAREFPPTARWFPAATSADRVFGRDGGTHEKSSTGRDPHDRNHESGAVAALSINSTERTSAAPNIPTAIEQGFPDIVADNWFGLLAPAGTPEPVITALNQAVVTALSEPSLKEDYARAGALPVPQSPAEFRSYIAAEEARWGEVIKRAKIQPE